MTTDKYFFVIIAIQLFTLATIEKKKHGLKLAYIFTGLFMLFIGFSEVLFNLI